MSQTRSDYFLQETRALAMASAAPSSANRKYTTPFAYQSSSSSRVSALPFVNRLSASLPSLKLIYELPHFWLKRAFLISSPHFRRALKWLKPSPGSVLLRLGVLLKPRYTHSFLPSHMKPTQASVSV